MQLTSHTRANKEFFAKGAAPSKRKWVEWIERGVVLGKLIDGEPWIDANHFAANDVLAAADKRDETTWMDLLA